MLLQLKSIFSNKFTILLLVISFIISYKSIYDINERINRPNYDIYYTYEELYLDWSDEYNRALRVLQNPDIKEENYLKYINWLTERQSLLSELYLESYKENSEKIKKLNFIYNLSSINFTANPDLDQLLIEELYSDKISKYIDSSLYNFDMALLGNFEYDYLNYEQLYSEPIYQRYKYQMDRDIYLIENNIEEIDYFTESPWTYLGETYSKDSIKSNVFTSFIILFTSFIATNSRHEKTFDLNSCKLLSKKKIFMNYIILGLVSSLIIIFSSDILSVIYMGFRYGFNGLYNPIPIFIDSLKGFKTYTNTRELSSVLSIGLADFYQIPKVSFYPYYYFNMSNISLGLFIILSFVFELLKIVYYSTIGTCIGLLIKNSKVSTILSATLIIINALINSSIKLFDAFLLKLDSGWNHLLGWTNISWLSGVIYMILGNTILIVFSYYYFKRKDLV